MSEANYSRRIYTRDVVPPSDYYYPNGGPIYIRAERSEAPCCVVTENPSTGPSSGPAATVPMGSDQ